MHSHRYTYINGMSLEAISQVNDWIMEEVREWWQRRKLLVLGN